MGSRPISNADRKEWSRLAKESKGSQTRESIEGGRRLLYDLRHKTSIQVTKEHRERREGAEKKKHEEGRRKAQWYAADSLLKFDEGHDWSRSDKASDWPHTTEPDQYCSFCRMNGCRAPKS